MNSQKGFTLIELLVVIAIIGVLSGVIIAALNSARNKGSNAAIKQTMTGLRAQAELIYDENDGFYNTVCGDAKVIQMLDSAGIASGFGAAAADCNSDNISWAASSPLKVPDGDGSTFWCVDNSGVSRGIMATLGTDFSCP